MSPGNKQIRSFVSIENLIAEGNNFISHPVAWTAKSFSKLFRYIPSQLTRTVVDARLSVDLSIILIILNLSVFWTPGQTNPHQGDGNMKHIGFHKTVITILWVDHIKCMKPITSMVILTLSQKSTQSHIQPKCAVNYFCWSWSSKNRNSVHLSVCFTIRDRGCWVAYQCLLVRYT